MYSRFFLQTVSPPAVFAAADTASAADSIGYYRTGPRKKRVEIRVRLLPFFRIFAGTFQLFREMMKKGFSFSRFCHIIIDGLSPERFVFTGSGDIFRKGMENVTVTDSILEQVHRIHFVGIGGSGMSPLAEILHAEGYQITGSDCGESDNRKRIEALGIPVYTGHRAENLGDTELVVYTAAVSRDNPELAAADARGIPVLERAKLLGILSRHYEQTVAVSGTHGKTTTTSMIAQILLEAGTDPSLFIGGRLPLIGANGRAGHSPYLICEACEFQDHYLEMTPAVAVVLNVDADHLDYFGTLDNVIRSFATFSAKATRAVIYNAEDANTCRAVEAAAAPKISFGTTEEADWSARQLTVFDGAYYAYDLYHDGSLFAHIRLGVPGRHNVLNSAAAAAAAFLCGATAEQIAVGLAHFRGAGRRFEFLGTFRGVTVADDYAHHPTEIAATLQAAKAMPYRRVWAVFQPFTYSRTAQHLQEFADTLSLADTAVVSDIMGSREQNDWNVSSTQIVERMTNGIYLPDFESIASFVAEQAAEGDLVITMGGGDVYKCARMIAAKLEQIPQ